MKNELIKNGLTEELANKVIELYKNWIPRERLNEVNEAKKALEATLKERDEQLETLKKSGGDVEALKAQIETLQTDNRNHQIEYENKIKDMQINNIVERTLTAAKAKNLKAVRALLDLTNAEIENDSIKGLDKQIKTLQEADDTKFLFETKQETKPGLSGVKPAESGDTKPDGTPNFKTMSYSQICEYLNNGGK